MKNAAYLFLASLFVMTGLAACGNQNRQIAEREERVEEQADKQKDAIEQNAEVQKEKIDQAAEQKKEAIDATTEVEKQKLDAQRKAADKSSKNFPDNMNFKTDSPAEKAKQR